MWRLPIVLRFVFGYCLAASSGAFCFLKWVNTWIFLSRWRYRNYDDRNLDFFLLWLKILQSISILKGTKAWRFLLPILIYVHYSMPFEIIVFNFRCYKHFIWADTFSSFILVHSKSSVNSQRLAWTEEHIKQTLF